MPRFKDNDFSFTQDGRLHIRNKKLAEKMSTFLNDEGFLIISIYPHDKQARLLKGIKSPPRKIDTLIPRRRRKKDPDYLALQGKFQPWPGTRCSKLEFKKQSSSTTEDEPDPGMTCEPPPPIADAGCGCDIITNMRC